MLGWVALGADEIVRVIGRFELQGFELQRVHSIAIGKQQRDLVDVSQDFCFSFSQRNNASTYQGTLLDRIFYYF